MGAPGLIGSQVPPGPGAVWEALAALKQQAQQALAFAASAQAVSSQLAANVATQVAALASGGTTWQGPVSTTGALSGGTVTASGALSGAALTISANSTVSGSETVGGLLKADAGMSSLDVKSRILASGWSSVWIDGTGRLGQSGSARRYKQDIEPAVIDTAAVLNLQPVQYRLKAAVEEFGDDARTEVGLIAEDLEPVAPWAVAYDAEGVIQGINYSTLTVALLAVAKAQQAQIKTLTRRLDKQALRAG